ncbi:Putative Macro domain-containing protein [Septoria linicola]|uniref:ADP-ribose 1''-phosphate phosphatase n=1 Tax=Septoria linicola TaxID=215465 RepID=A0A9Q9AW64_9PEZI|nr:Putative Macro domain-containing protein [Septoria linicola]
MTEMAPPATRTSFKRGASDDEDDNSQSSSKRAKPSNRPSIAGSRSQGSQGSQDKSSAPPQRKPFKPDGRPIPYIEPRPNGSWRMITGEQLAYTPEELPTVAPLSAYKNEIRERERLEREKREEEQREKQTLLTQSFGQTTDSGRRRASPPPSKKGSRMTTNPSTSTSAKPSSSSSPPLKITETIGDIFSAPPNSILIHACNTEGTWGAGIAKAFHSHYPSAFESYKTHCQLNGGELIGKALLIPPQDDEKHFIGCLFTSIAKGARKDSPDRILRATGPAMRDLMRQVRSWNVNGTKDGKGKKVGEVRMCKINSGLFNVKWEKTREALQGIPGDSDGIREIKVVSRSEED